MQYHLIYINKKQKKRKRSIKFRQNIEAHTNDNVRSKNLIRKHRDSRDFLGGFGKERHRRDSSAPVINLGFEDPEVLLNFEKLKVKDLEEELARRLDSLDKVKAERDELLKTYNGNDASGAAIAAETESKIIQIKQEKQQTETQLVEAVTSKAQLAQKCAMEIMRLTMILNTLQQMPKIKEIVQLLMDESAKDSNKNGSLLG